MQVTQARLKEILHYDPVVGVFVWKQANSNRSSVGAIPTPMKGRSYVQIRIDGTRYYAHRLAWLYVHGQFPTLGLDHKNTIKFDNAIRNLREATDTQNGANKTARGRSGIKGVRICRKTGRWVARIKGKHIGTYDTPEIASFVYYLSAVEEYGEFARG